MLMKFDRCFSFVYFNWKKKIVIFLIIEKFPLSNFPGISPLDPPGTNSVLNWNDGYGKGKIGIINCDFTHHCSATSSPWCTLLAQSFSSQGRSPVTSSKPRKDQHLLSSQFAFPPSQSRDGLRPWSCLWL